MIIGVSEDEGNLDLVKRFVAERRVNYPIAMSTPEVSRVFSGVTSLPTTFVLDRDGRIVQRHLGQLDPAPDVRGLALQRLNAESCTCGCKLSVAKSRIDDPACSVSLPLARRIVEDIKRGQPGGD